MQLTPRHARNTLKLGPADGQHKLETGVGGGGGAANSSLFCFGVMSSP